MTTPTLLLAVATLPAAGAYQAVPTSPAAGAPIPLFTHSAPTRGCTLSFAYVQGAAGGQAAVKILQFDGAEWSQVPSPVDQGYEGINLGVGTGTYSLSIEVKFGMGAIAVIAAEVGATGTPGTLGCEMVTG